MPDLWPAVLAAVNAIVTEMPQHGDLLNERYLHHYFTHRLQSAAPGLLPLLDPAAPLLLHPEWPTYKEATGLTAGGTYRKEDGVYLPAEGGRKGGFIDFALGPYTAPEIGVEFKLFGNDWGGEGVAFDYMKLLDRRNPFRAVVSAVLILRPQRVAVAGWRDELERAIASAYGRATGRLGGRCVTAAERVQRFVVTEVAPGERRHWSNNSVGGPFTANAGVPLVTG